MIKLVGSYVLHIAIALVLALAFKLELHEVVAFIALYGAIVTHINHVNLRAELVEALSKAKRNETSIS